MIMTSTVVDCFNPLFIVTSLLWQNVDNETPNLTPTELLIRKGVKNECLPGNISVPVN